MDYVTQTAVDFGTGGTFLGRRAGSSLLFTATQCVDASRKFPQPLEPSRFVLILFRQLLLFTIGYYYIMLWSLTPVDCSGNSWHSRG